MNENLEKKNLVDVENRVISHNGVALEEDEPKIWCSCCTCCYVEDSYPQVVLQEIESSKKVLVLDLDETLVHCSFYPPELYDLTIPITIDSIQYDIYVQKRPHLDEFLDEMLKLFYVVIFTASLSPYANPIIDRICPSIPLTQRLFRESCTFHHGMYVKDLGIFQTPLDNVIIVDNNPCSFSMHKENAILSETWEGDREDNELIDRILPLLRKCAGSRDVRDVITSSKPN